MKPVAILGSGPAGLLAAHAVGLTGQPIAVFGLGEKSQIGGAQFLHMAIPELTDEEPDAIISYEVRGTEVGYRRKVYGDSVVPFTSFQGVHDGDTQPAWSMTKIYDFLWGEFGERMNEAMVSPMWIDENKNNFSAIVSSVPRHALCRSVHGLDTVSHRFDSQRIKIMQDNILQVSEGTIVYDGTPDTSWYRCSLLFGSGGTEWGDHYNPPMETITVSKPIRTTCDCYSDVIHVGRYGKWQKGVLIHDGFVTSLRELNERGVISLGPTLA